MKRKFLSTIVCLTIILIAVLLLPNKASAAATVASGTCGYNLTWTLDDAGTLTISGTGAMVNFSNIFATPWYSRQESITKIIIQDGVTSVGTYAFSGCTKLTDITLPSSVTEVKAAAFYLCNSLTNITIPDSVTSIGVAVFYGCSNLETIVIPFVGESKKTETDKYQYPLGYIFGISSYTGGTAIEQYYYGSSSNSTTSDTFYIPSSLKSVTITGGSIPYGSFYNCSNLTSITIGNSVTSISSNAFYGCSSLTSITIPDGITSIGNSAFSGCRSLQSIIIPDSVTSIGSSTFSGCSSLTSITIPDGITSIGNSAFSGCSSLTSITIPDGITSIGSSTFSGCSSLTSITIPDGITSIGNSAFSGCSSLTSITIPDSVTNIGYYAFENCSIKKLIIADGSKKVTSAMVVCNDSLQEIIISDSVTSIASSVFSGCGSLKSITIPFIGESINTSSNTYQYPLGYIFGTSSYTGGAATKQYYGSNYTTYYIPSSLKSVTVTGGSIPYGAFYNCSNLTSITIGDNVTSIENPVFFGCSNLENLTIPFIGESIETSSNTYHHPLGYIFGTSSYTGGTATNQYYGSNYTTYYIPSSLKSVTVTGGSIPYGAFYNCSSLTSVTLGNNVTSIGDEAFNRCINLESITIPFVGDSIKTETDKYQYPLGYLFGTSQYYRATATRQNYYGSSTTSATYDIYYIPWSLKSVTVTGGNILYGAFYNCNSLTSITIGNDVTSIGKNAFRGCSDLTSITIPDSVTSIGSYAFYECSSLSSITIPDSVSNIGSYAFYECSSLSSVTIPDGVSNIGSYVFYKCSSLTSITIPDSVTSIGDFAFYNCSNLTNVYYTGTQEQWDAIKIGTSNKPLLSANLTVNYMHHNCEEFGDWVITKAPTFTSAGEQHLVCSQCGETVVRTLEMLVGEVSKWNVALADNLLVNFYMNISKSIEQTSKVRIYVGENAYTLPVSALEKTKDDLYIARISVAAAQMNDFIYVSVISGESSGHTYSYTIRQYANTILADESNSQYHALVKEMLNYGAMAQIYFDYDTEYLANAGITGVAIEEVPETDEEMTISDKISGLNFYGASLVFRDRIAVRYYFTGDIAGCTFTANGNTYTPVTKDGMYYIEVPDILPQNLDQQITLVVADTAGDTLSVSYSPMNYIVRMNTKGSENLKNLLKALYNYHLAAKQLNSSAA